MSNSLSWRRVFSWQGRLGRRDYLAGRLGLQFIAALVVVPIHLVLPIDAWQASLAVLFSAMVVFSIPWSALVTQRAHDIGLSALIVLIATLILASPLFALLISTVRGDPSLWEIFPGWLIQSCAFALGAIDLALILVPGQNKINHFGSPP